MKTRDPFFDIVKLLAIFMVVFRHVMFSSDTMLYPTWVSNATVGMNMPVFFLLSGWFAWPTIATHDWHKLGRHLKSYMWPTVSLIVIFSCVQPFYDGMSWNFKDVFVSSVKTWLFGPWFIWVLCECYLIMFVAHIAGGRLQRTLVIMVAVSVFLMFVPEYRGIVYKLSLRHMLPYFVIGAVFRKLDIRLWEGNLLGPLALLAFLLVVFLEGDASKNGMSFYSGDSSWSAFLSWQSAATFFARPIVGVVGSIGFMWGIKRILSVALMVRQLNVAVDVFAKGGTLTLAIYLLHQKLLAWLVGICPELVATRLYILVTALVLFSFCWIVSEVTVNRIPFTRKWIWGK